MPNTGHTSMNKTKFCFVLFIIVFSIDTDRFVALEAATQLTKREYSICENCIVAQQPIGHTRKIERFLIHEFFLLLEYISDRICQK